MEGSMATNRRVVVIDECDQCPHWCFSSTGICALLDCIVDSGKIPPECPLDTPAEAAEGAFNIDEEP
jgi:hypothetical protein